MGDGSSNMGDLANFLLPNAPTCIVACSAADARFWRSNSRFGSWDLITEMHNPVAAQHEKSFASDRPGRAFDIVGSGRHSMSQTESGQDHELLEFARQVSSFLNRSIANNDFSHIVILAAPKFLGRLRTALSDTALKAVVLAEAKNLSNLDDDEIKKYFE